MEDLVFYHGFKSEPYTTVNIISQFTYIKMQSINDLIRNHKIKFEKLGVLRFEIVKPMKGSQGGRPRKEWHLNEPQATLLMTMLDNTPVVAEFKLNLVKAFYELREEVTKQQLMLERNRKTNKDLGEVIHEYLPDNPYAYPNYHTLAYKVVTGLIPSKLCKQRHVKNAPDALTSDELEKMEQVRHAIAGLIVIGQDYESIKLAVTKKKV